MGNITLGIKVDDALRDRLKNHAQQLGCTSHWLHKQALLSYLDALDGGAAPPELAHMLGQNATVSTATAEVGAVQEEDVPAPQPFMEFAQDVQPQSVLRSAITAAYRRDESECVAMLLPHARMEQADLVQAMAEKMTDALRSKKGAGPVEGLIQEFSLSSQEGVALMCLAEALLRIPDKATRDALIRDKIANNDWKSHIRGGSQSLFVNAAAWGLMITGKLVAVNSEQGLSASLSRLIGKGGEPLIRQGVNMAMRMMGEQFVSGRTISEAIANNRTMESRGFRYSYDMLGEAATTIEDADRYYASYEHSIHAIGRASAGRGIYEGPGISIKLSALHPRYSRAQRERVVRELFPRVRKLYALARSYDIGVNIDAEEADRLDLSLDLLEELCLAPELQGWNGIGFVVQAYMKRAPFVIDCVIDLARRSSHRLMVRLVKGAYWDSEIKRAQVDGLEGYPVFTRKIYTDICYLACARKLLGAPQSIYPQFATHNARTLASVFHMAGQNYYQGQYEFQCLHGMGEPLYHDIVGKTGKGRPCRVYAPVGNYETLLPYLVRRLLENGANTSFVNQIGDRNVPTRELVQDPVMLAERIQPLGAPHDHIALPRALYGPVEQGARLNSQGVDLSNEHRLGSLSAALLNSAALAWQAAPMLGDNAKRWEGTRAEDLRNPADLRDVVGRVMPADALDVQAAVDFAQKAASIWQSTPARERARCLRNAAQIMEQRMQTLMGILVREAGKSLPNAIAEVREAVDFLRYYAEQAEQELEDGDQHRPLGPVLCISPWNFPLAIFTGQIAAALVAGNPVLAKPAEQTPLIAAQAIAILRDAGIPSNVVQLLPGTGETVGAALVAHPAVCGVMFTGSTEVAQTIARTLAERLSDEGKTIPLIAETGGQNAMVVDSSALAEQVVYDVLNSAFDSAGQRCSALRILCIQEDAADRVLGLLRGAMQELRVGNPDRLNVDVGPVIDGDAQNAILAHIESLRAAGARVDQVPMDASCRHGHFVPPTMIELTDLTLLQREIFGPVLHVLRYKRDELDALMAQINATGYGLTFGVHSRIDETIDKVTRLIHAGNIYVNRNIVGAVVGVQPFGGEGLSGTGPKAGGPLYLHRLVHTRMATLPTWCNFSGQWPVEQVLPGPTGESNIYALRPRGTVLCVAQTRAGIAAQCKAVQASGNKLLVLDGAPAHRWASESGIAPHDIAFIDDAHIDDAVFDAVLFEGDSDALQRFNARVAARSGPIVGVHGLAPEAVANGQTYAINTLLAERSVSVNTAAAGGNAKLMTIG